MPSARVPPLVFLMLVLPGVLGGSGANQPKPAPEAEPSRAKPDSVAQPSPAGQCTESQRETGASGCGCSATSRSAGPGASSGPRRKLVAKGSAPGAVVPLTRLIPIPGGRFEMGTQPKARPTPPEMTATWRDMDVLCRIG